MILTPYQPTKDDIITVIKPYLDAAEIKAVCIYESEDKNVQMENLKNCKLARLKSKFRII